MDENDMADRFHRMLRTFLVANYRELRHPIHRFDKSKTVPMDNIGDIVDALLELLSMPSPVPTAEDVGNRVLSLCRDYISTPLAELTRRVTYLCSLATNIEPFLHKLLALRTGNAEQDRRNLCNLLKTVAKYEGDLLYKPNPDELYNYLSKQLTENAILHDAYYFRNHYGAHTAPSITAAEEQRFGDSIIGALLIIVRRNIDLAPKIHQRMERDKRIEYNLRVYLTQLRNSFDDTKWNYTYYVPLNAERGRPLDECVDDFLNSADDRLLAIGGRIGAGKSTFLERLCFQLADRALSSADNVLSSEKWIPIHFELKGFDRGTLRKRLYNQLKIQDRLHWPKSLPTRRFLICLDGLDEIVGTIRYQTILSEIEELATFPNVKVIVTSRPQTIPTRWRGHVVCIMPLSREEVRNYFRQRLNELAEEVEKLLKQKPDLVDILQDPLMAETACKYWHQIEDDFVTAQRDPADEEVQSNQAMILQNALAEGPLLETLYEALFTHHLRRTLGKHMTAKQAQQVKVLAELAVNIDGDPFAHWELVSSVFASAGAAPQIWLDLFIDMGLLQKVGMQQFAFRNNTVKAYFAAVRLRELVCTKRSLQLAMRFIKQANEFWQHCIQLLQEIAPRQDLSPITSHLARPA